MRRSFESWRRGLREQDQVWLEERVLTWLAKIQDKKGTVYNLYRFCRWCGMGPHELYQMKEDPRCMDVEFLLDKLVADREWTWKGKPLTEWQKASMVKAVRSFFKHNYRDLAKIAGRITPTKVKPYRKPTKEDLFRLWKAAYNPRDRSLVTFANCTMIARGTIPYLKWHHFDEDWENQDIPHIGLPDTIIKGHGKGRYKGVEQHTFLTPEAKRDLVYYRDWMQHTYGVKPTPDSAVYRQLVQPYHAIRNPDLGMIAVRLSQRVHGVEFSLHDARRYVQTALEEVKFPHNWIQKIKGRKVRGEDSPYSRPEIEKLRAAYREAVPYLSFVDIKVEEEQRYEEIRTVMEAHEIERKELQKQIQDLSKRLEVGLDPLLHDIENLAQLPGGKEFFKDIVEYAKAKLSEKLKQKIE